MKIAFYKARYGDWVDKVISFVTFSRYSHCELVFPNGEFASSSPRDGGIRIKTIEQDVKWEIFDVHTTMNENEIRKWFEENGSDTYDWIGAIMSVFGIMIKREDKKFCSYVCALMLGMYPAVTPGKLYKLLTK